MNKGIIPKYDTFDRKHEKYGCRDIIYRFTIELL